MKFSRSLNPKKMTGRLKRSFCLQSIMVFLFLFSNSVSARTARKLESTGKLESAGKLESTGKLESARKLKSANKLEKGIWIKAPQMPSQEFKAHIKALGPSHKSYAQNLLKQKREESKSFRLKDRLIEAQEFYLSGEGKKAANAFYEITELALKADWDKEDRRIILYSFLRLAQNEEDLEKRKALLLSAENFAPFQINRENYPDHSLFPPPLMEELKLVQEKTNQLSVDWKTLFPQHEIILINGKKIQKDKKSEIPQSFYRVTALSSSHKSWSKNLNLSKLLTQKIKTNSLTKGTCEKLQIKSSALKEHIHIASFSNCPPRAFLQLKTNKPKAHKQSSFIQTVFSSDLDTSSQPIRDFHSADLLNPPPPELENDPAVQKSSRLSNIPPWLIIGAGIVVLSLAVSLDDKPKKKKGDYVY